MLSVRPQQPPANPHFFLSYKLLEGSRLKAVESKKQWAAETNRSGDSQPVLDPNDDRLYVMDGFCYSFAVRDLKTPRSSHR